MTYEKLIDELTIHILEQADDCYQLKLPGENSEKEHELMRSIRSRLRETLDPFKKKV